MSPRKSRPASLTSRALSIPQIRDETFVDQVFHDVKGEAHPPPLGHLARLELKSDLRLRVSLAERGFVELDQVLEVRTGQLASVDGRQGVDQLGYHPADAPREAVEKDGGHLALSRFAHRRKGRVEPLEQHLLCVHRRQEPFRRGESERSEEHTSELQSLRTISYAVF